MRKRWFLVGVIFLLVAWLLVGCGVPQEKYDVAVSDLGKAQQELQSVKAQLEATQAELEATKTKLADSEATVSTLQGKLTASEATVATLQTNLKTANAEATRLRADVSTQQSINSALSTELKKVKDPRHFETLAELTDWLNKDDTNTKYAAETTMRKGFILQVRALRDGYLLPLALYLDTAGTLWWGNRAVIGDSVYAVLASDDRITRMASGIQPLPSHPLPLD